MMTHVEQSIQDTELKGQAKEIIKQRLDSKDKTFGSQYLPKNSKQ